MDQTKALTFNRIPILGSSKISFDEWKFAFDHWCKTFGIKEESEKVDYLFAITDKTARTIVYNSLNKKTHDSYETILTNLSKHFKKSSTKNSRILELSSITIKKDESISDFDLRFSDLLNQVSKTVNISEVIIISYYINAFRNWPRIYESLMEEEPITLEEAMKITSKKEKIMKLIKENKEKGSNNKVKSSNSDRKLDTHYNYSNKNFQNQNVNNNENKHKYNNHYNYYNQNKNTNYNRQHVNDYYNNSRLTNKTNDNNNKNKLNNNEMEELTKKLSELTLNFCVNYLQGHNKEECSDDDNKYNNENNNIDNDDESLN